MKKRRRLAEKLKVAMLLLSVIASTLFYAPMDVKAQTYSDSVHVSNVASSSEVERLASSVQGSVDVSGIYYIGDIKKSFPTSSLVTGLESDSLYELDYTLTYNLKADHTCTLYGNYVNFGDLSLGYKYGTPWETTDHNFTYTGKLYAKGSQLMNQVMSCYSAVFVWKQDIILNYDISVDVAVKSCTKVAQTDTEQYNKGYQDGLAEGQKQGYNNGYSEGFAKGENEGYDKGFQAGVNSVDTDSIYEAGRKAGYDAGYQKGYDDGHKAGYDEAMERIESWGADTTKYPVLVHSSSPDSSTYDKHIRFFGNRGDNFQSEFSILVWSLPIGSGGTDQIDPNHVYKFVVDTPLFELVESDQFNTGYFNYSLYFCVGGNEYQIDNTARNYDFANATASWLDIFIPGSELSTSAFLKFKFDSMSIRGDNGGTFVDLQIKSSYVSGSGYDLYDLGPMNNTQNQIANQTDQLTNGFDNSAGNASHDKFQGSVNDYEAAEDSLFATATDNIGKFDFFDFQSIAAVVTGITFVTSTMTKIFDLSGGIDGMGIILSVLFSVMLVAMALGLYKRYQSTGHGSSGTGNSDKSDKGGGK